MGGFEHAKAYLEEVGELLSELTSRQDQLLTLRDYGDELAPMDEALKVDENLVPGCTSATHIVVMVDTDDVVTIVGDSLSYISKGYIFILLEALNGCTVEDITQNVDPAIQKFAEDAGVRLSMIASRANVFERVFRFIQKKTVEAVASRS